MQENMKNTVTEGNGKRNSRKWLKGNFSSSIFFNPVVSSNVVEIVSKFDSNKSPGYDGIHPKVLKRSISAIAEPLCNIINFALAKGIFPDSLKVAKVIHVFKKGNRSFLTNYRPLFYLFLVLKKM